MRRTRPSRRDWVPSGQSYSPDMRGFTEDEIAFLKAYINPMHDNNYARCPGVPNSTGARSYVIHQRLVVDDVKPDSTGRIVLVATGLPELPLIQFDTANFTTRSFTWPSIMNPAHTVATTDPISTYLSDYMKLNCVGAYRQCCGGIKIEDITASMYRTGAISGSRNLAGYDLQPIILPPNSGPYGTTGALGSPTIFARVYDSISLSTADNETLSNSMYSGASEDGFYLNQTFLEPTANYIPRIDYEQKALQSYAIDPSNVNIVRFYPTLHAYKLANDNAIRLNGYKEGTGSAWTAGATSVQIAGGMGVSAPSMTAINIVGSGLNPTQSVWRVSMVASFELIPTSGSKLTTLCKPCMPSNIKCLQALADAVAQMPDGYPASANFFNELWDKFKSVYKAISPAIAPIVTDLVPPQYKPLVSTIKKVADAVTEVKKDVKDMALSLPASAPTAPPTSASNRRR